MKEDTMKNSATRVMLVVFVFILGCSAEMLDCTKDPWPNSRIFACNASFWVSGKAPDVTPCDHAVKRNFCAPSASDAELLIGVVIDAVVEASPGLRGGTVRWKCADTGKTKGPKYHRRPLPTPLGLDGGAGGAATAEPSLADLEAANPPADEWQNINACQDTTGWNSKSIPGTPPPTTCPGIAWPAGVNPVAPCIPCFVEKCCATYGTALAAAKMADAQDPTMSGANFNELLADALAWAAAGTTASATYKQPPQPFRQPAAMFDECMVLSCQGNNGCVHP